MNALGDYQKDRDSFIEISKKLIGDDVVRLIIQLGELLKKSSGKNKGMALLKQEIL